MTAGDDAERSDEEERRLCPPATMQNEAMWGHPQPHSVEEAWGHHPIAGESERHD